MGRLPLAERFWRRVVKAEGDGCWEWIGGRSGNYGRFRIDRTHTGWAHRYAYELQNGPLAPGQCACHRCDNPLCMRGDHMFSGTRAENIYDRDAKGRTSRGAAHGETIRAAWARRKALVSC